MSATPYEFSFNDQLPRIFEVVKALFSAEPGAAWIKKDRKDSAPVSSAIHECCSKLQTEWEKAFGAGTIKTLKSIKKTVRKHLLDYASVSKHKEGSTLRQKRKSWRENNSLLLDCFAPGVSPESFDENEKIFYEDQLTSRVMFISEEIDREYEAARQLKINAANKQICSEKSEIEYIYSSDQEVDQAECTKDEDYVMNSTFIDHPNSFHDQSSTLQNRSGVYRISKETKSVGVQTDPSFSKPPVRKVKNCTDSIKSALASMTVAAEISPEKARVAAQVFSKLFYKHTYFLSIEEKFPDHIRKKPRTASDYDLYVDVLPDKKTIAAYKHGQSLLREQSASFALVNKSDTSKAILHFDTTRRSRIEGDWPSLIINICSKLKSEEYTLRPLFFAY